MSCDVCRGTNSSRCPVCGDEPDIVSCPKCRGLGLVNCYARSLRSGEEIEVTAETYLGIPATEEEARASGRHYYRSFAEDCEFCGGSGEVRDKVIDEELGKIRELAPSIAIIEV